MVEKPNTPPANVAAVVPNELVLAAIARAEHHRARDHPGVLLREAAEHLGLTPGAWTTRRLRPRFEALERAGALERSRRHGIVMWRLTKQSGERLAKAHRLRQLPGLPESPQHISWRAARDSSRERIGEFHQGLRSALGDAAVLLDDARRPRSDAWFELGARLRRACWRLGSATYCLHEWAEPGDDRADVDDLRAPGDEALTPAERARRRARRAGRRNLRLWNDTD